MWNTFSCGKVNFEYSWWLEYHEVFKNGVRSYLTLFSKHNTKRNCILQNLQCVSLHKLSAILARFFPAIVLPMFSDVFRDVQVECGCYDCDVTSTQISDDCELGLSLDPGADSSIAFNFHKCKSKNFTFWREKGPRLLLWNFERNVFITGVWRLFSVKYLFGEANIAQNFLLFYRTVKKL